MSRLGWIWRSMPGALALAALLAVVSPAHAIPAFARQTGQNCVSCHAGGQYPELTPYGRLFKMTGYTIGQRATVPAAIMVEGSMASMKNTAAVNNSLTNNTGAGLPTPVDSGTPVADVASLFLGGKITNNFGAFAQYTWDFHGAADDAGNNTKTHGSADNMDFRFADHIITPSQDFIYGLSLNNNPSVSDPWNTSWAWAQYVPASGGIGANSFLDAAAPYPGSGLPGDLYAGLTAYAYWQKTIYAELGVYHTAKGLFHFFNANNDPTASVLHGSNNPYWRLAYTRDWGAHSLMVGTEGMYAHPYDTTNGVDYGDVQSYQSVKSIGIDSQYQYLLDPHTVTAQVMLQHQTQYPSFLDANINGTVPATVTTFRAKGSYVYRAFVGGAAAIFNASGDPSIATRGAMLEAFVLPVQNIRVGLQYTMFSRLPGVDHPSDANTLFFYVWAAY